MHSRILIQKKNLLPAVIQTAQLFDVSDNRGALVKNTEQIRDNNPRCRPPHDIVMKI